MCDQNGNGFDQEPAPGFDLLLSRKWTKNFCSVV